MKKIILTFFIIATIATQAALNGKAVKLTADKVSVAVGVKDTVTLTVTFQDGKGPNGTEVAVGLAAETEIDTLDGTATVNDDVAVWPGDTEDLASDWYIPYGIIDGDFTIKRFPADLKVAVVSIDRVEFFPGGINLPIPAKLTDESWVQGDFTVGIIDVLNPVIAHFRTVPYPNDAVWPKEEVGNLDFPLWEKVAEVAPQFLLEGIEEPRKPITSITFPDADTYTISAQCGTSIKSMRVIVSQSFGVNLSQYSNDKNRLQKNVLENTDYDTVAYITGDHEEEEFGDPEIIWLVSWKYWDDETFLFKVIPGAAVNASFNDRFPFLEETLKSPAVSNGFWKSDGILRIEIDSPTGNSAEDQHEFTSHREYEVDTSNPISIQASSSTQHLIEEVPTGGTGSAILEVTNLFGGILPASSGYDLFNEDELSIVMIETESPEAGSFSLFADGSNIAVPPLPINNFVRLIARPITDSTTYQIIKWKDDGTTEILAQTLEIGLDRLFLLKGAPYTVYDPANQSATNPFDPDDPFYNPYP